MKDQNKHSKGFLTISCAPFQNGTLELLHLQELTIGTDPDACKLIVKGTGISRTHCFLSYNATSGTYLLMDLSTNGTYLSNGQRLPLQFLMELEPGTEFYLSEPENRFKLG